MAWGNTGHGEIMLLLSKKLPPCWLASMVLVGAKQPVEGESYPAMNPVSYNNEGTNIRK